MRIEIPGGHITIADDSEKAKKIKQGYEYTIVDGNLIVGEEKNNINFEETISQLKEKNVSVKDLNKIVLHILEKLENIIY